jgi:ADP-heptose:LPS heptosyltransferase
MVLSTGAIRAIASAHPTIAVDVLASVVNEAVLRGNPHVGTVISVNKKRPWSYFAAIARIRRVRYDAVVDPKILSPSLTTALLMLCSGATHRIGLAGRGNDSVLTVAVTPLAGATHYVDRAAALVTPFGVRASVAGDPTPLQPELFLTTQELSEGEAHWRAAEVSADARVPGRRLVVNVSATKARRYWPESHFIATILNLRRSYPDLAVLMVGLPADADRMSRIATGAGVTAVRTPHYRQMMAIVATSHVVFTADTSVTHIGSAFRKAVVVMFPGRREGDTWGPYGTPGTVLSAGGLPLETLEVNSATRALEELLVSR